MLCSWILFPSGPVGVANGISLDRSSPTPPVLNDELPQLVASGIRSLKVFLTYDPLRFDDAGYLAVLSGTRRLGCLVTVHCDNHDAVA